MAQAITPGKASISQPAWFTFLRILLGVILIWKGINFIRDTAALKSLIAYTNVGIFTQNAATLALLVTILTLLCGFLITVGLFTRIASMVQIPIILVAIFFVNVRAMGSNAVELVLTVIVFLLLILFAMKGSGALSADEYFRRGAVRDNRSDRLFR